MNLLAATALANDSAWAVYAVGALMVVAGATGVVLQRNPVHCALALVTAIFGIALLFIDQGADFLAAVQIIVYAGAVVILFLFVIMLLGVDRKEARAPTKLRAMVPVAVVVGLVGAIELLVLSRVHDWATGIPSGTETLNGPGENVQKLGQTIFASYLLPFEMTSVLLVIAVVAAVVLVRRSNQQGAGAGHKPATGARPGVKAPAAAPVAAPAPTPVPAVAPGAPEKATGEHAGQPGSSEL